MIDVQEIELDAENIPHLAAHDVTPEDVAAVWSGSPQYFRNASGRSATHVMIGEDARGRVLYIPMLETHPGRWRPITGWESRFARRIYRRD